MRLGWRTRNSEHFLFCQGKWSGRGDLNSRPPAPKAGALPGCATPRHEVRFDYMALCDSVAEFAPVRVRPSVHIKLRRFWNEIGDITIELQPRLLHVLPEK